MYTFGFPCHLASFYHVMINHYSLFWLIPVIYNVWKLLNVYMLIMAIFYFLIFLLLSINLFSNYSKTYVNLFFMFSDPLGVPSIHLPSALHGPVPMFHVGWLTSKSWVPFLGSLLYCFYLPNSVFCFLGSYHYFDHM